MPLFWCNKEEVENDIKKMVKKPTSIVRNVACYDGSGQRHACDVFDNGWAGSKKDEETQRLCQQY
jgi:hypothetical protein